MHNASLFAQDYFQSISITISSDKDHLHWKSKLCGIKWRLTFFSTAYLTLAKKSTALLESKKKKNNPIYTHNPSCSKFSVSLVFSIAYFHGVILLSGICLLVSCLSHLIKMWVSLAICRQSMNVCWLLCKEYF